MKLFLTSSANQVLDQIVPKLNKNPEELSVAFVPTASNPYGENQPWVVADREKLMELGFRVFDFDLDGKSAQEVEKFLSDKDIIFVAGGNVFYLLQKARESGFDKIVIEEVKSGKIYIGSSAGSYIATDDISTTTWKRDKNRYGVTDMTGIGLVPFAIFPHYEDKHKDLVETRKKELNQELFIIRDDEMIEV
jgi:dipeptidase E